MTQAAGSTPAEAVASRPPIPSLGRPAALRAALEQWPASLLFAVAFTVAFAAKRPSQLFQAQLFAEDGTVFIADALSRGWSVLVSPRVGYLELFPRITSRLVIGFDMAYWPLVANLSALAATFALFLYAMRLSLPLSERLAAASLICLVPFGAAVYANMTYFLVIPLMFYPLMLRDVERAGRVARRHHLLLGVVSATGPWPLFLFPVAIALWLRRRAIAGAAALAASHVVVFGVAATMLLLSPGKGAPILAVPSAHYLAGLACDTMRGLFALRGGGAGIIAPVLTALGTISALSCLVEAIRREQLLLAAAVIGGVAILAGGLWRAMSSFTTIPPLQPWGGGERYFVLLLSAISILVLSTLCDARRRPGTPGLVVGGAVLALAMMAVNGVANYSRPPLPDFNWVAEVERSRTQHVKEIRIPPGGEWRLRLP